MVASEGRSFSHARAGGVVLDGIGVADIHFIFLDFLRSSSV